MVEKTKHKMIDGIECKCCSVCKKWLPLDRFSVHSKTLDSLRCYCRDCQKISAAEYRFRNREQIRSARRSRDRRKERNMPWPKYRIYEAGAKERDLSFNLTFEEFMKYWKQPCVYCGQPIETIGLDRVDNSVGYEATNVVPCCKDCNRAKSVLPQMEFISLCKAIAERWKDVM